MKKCTFFSFGTLLVMAILCYAIDYLLLKDNIFHGSITAIIDQSQRLTLKSHLLVLGILPIYIGLVLFGSISIVMYVRSALHQILWPTSNKYKAKSHTARLRY